MSITIILLAIAGWALHNLKKLSKARGKLGNKFEFGVYISRHMVDIIISVIATVVILYISPVEVTKVLAFLIGYFSQSIIRDLLKKDLWKGIFNK